MHSSFGESCCTKHHNPNRLRGVRWMQSRVLLGRREIACLCADGNSWETRKANPHLRRCREAAKLEAAQSNLQAWDQAHRKDESACFPLSSSLSITALLSDSCHIMTASLDTSRLML